MVFDWDQSKNQRLIEERNISFERIVVAIDTGKLIDILQHHNQKKYQDQLLLIVEIDNYIWVVPTIEKKDSYFMKTAFPSRKFTDIYLPESRL